jgi:D-alanyl-D-alanine carboxypeptidase/D-alanyl-D-alanine-endopeptidase (penicillin-binding protein 4)
VVRELDSPPLSALLQHMLRESDNFYAEVLLKDLAAWHHGEDAGATTSGGRRVGVRALRGLGINMDSTTWTDGSGLAYTNRVTARSLGQVLGIGAQMPWGDAWIDAFARSGTYGTLRKRLTRVPYRGRVSAKTGTLAHASALSGFATRASNGRRYGFVVLSSLPAGRSLSYSAARRLQDRIAMVLVR